MSLELVAIELQGFALLLILRRMAQAIRKDINATTLLKILKMYASRNYGGVYADSTGRIETETYETEGEFIDE